MYNTALLPNGSIMSDTWGKLFSLQYYFLLKKGTDTWSKHFFLECQFSLIEFIIKGSIYKNFANFFSEQFYNSFENIYYIEFKNKKKCGSEFNNSLY